MNEDAAEVRIYNALVALLHRGLHQWSLAPGSPGGINDLAVDATVGGLSRFIETRTAPLASRVEYSERGDPYDAESGAGRAAKGD